MNDVGRQIRPRRTAPPPGASVLHRIDWKHGSFVVVSLALHLGVVEWARAMDFPIEERLEALVEHIAVFTMPNPPPIGAGTPEVVGDAPDDPEPALRPPRPPLNCGLKLERADPVRVGINALIASLGSGDSVVADVLRGGSASSDLDEILSQIAGVDVASRDPGSGLRLRGDGRGGEVVEIDGFHGPAGDQEVDGGAAVPERIVGSIGVRPPVDEPSTGFLRPEDVRRVVNQRIAAIRMCYERRLQHDRTLQGRVTVRFTIAPAGVVTAAEATENTLADPAVGACIAATFRRFRFPSPEGGSATFSFPFVLQPGS